MEEILFKKPIFSNEEEFFLKPFFTNLDKSVYALTLLPPELVGALVSRASRSKDDLRIVFLNDFIKPFLDTPSGQAFYQFSKFFHQYPYEVLFANPKAREFYLKWLADYGDDSIAQMSGVHLVFSSLSQIAIKHFENQRIGLAPIEKSTRYVDFSEKINNHFLYLTPPEIKKLNLEKEYESLMDQVFNFYIQASTTYLDFLKKKYPNEKERVLKTKVYDEVRRILPLSTLSQVAFFGNGQAFEYLINRSLAHPLEEIRWAGKMAYEELIKIIPAFLRRIEKPETQDYQRYLGERSERILKLIQEINWQRKEIKASSDVRLLAYDPEGEDKIIAGLLYPLLNESFDSVLAKVKKLTLTQKERILQEILKDRKYRWQKMPRALELVYLKFEILTNIGAWRDLQRHRMQTLINQFFTVEEGFDLPAVFEELGMKNEILNLISQIEKFYQKIKKINFWAAQYSVLFLHKIRFLQFQNLREFFWETELRSTSQGHPDYRKIEHQKVRLIEKIYPLISKYLIIDWQDYEFPRRGEDERIKKKEEELKKFLEKV